MTTSLLPLVSYHFTSGPWKTLWVRLGYDPRIDPEAKQYQCLDYRVPKEVDIVEAQNHWRLGLRRKPSKGSDTSDDGVDQRNFTYPFGVKSL